MSESLINTIYLAIAFLILFGSAELIYHKTKLKCEFTRKYVHIVTGLITLLFPLLIGNHWLVLFLCGSFFVILLLSIKVNMLPSINNVDRVSRGSILYPITIYLCYLVYQEQAQYMYFYIPVLTLALADPIACLVGKKFPRVPFTTFGNRKTLSGSLGFLGMALLISIVTMSMLETMEWKEILITAICVAVFTAIAEAIAHKGYDNITIPGSAILALVLVSKFLI